MKSLILRVLILMLLSDGATAESADNYLALARNQLAENLEQFSKSLEICEKSENTLDKGVLSGLDLTDQQLKVVLQYHNAKARFECSKSEILNYLVSASILVNFDNQLAENIALSNGLITQDALTVFKLEREYSKLPDVIREYLNTVVSLKKPFDLRKTAVNFGL